MRQFINSPQGNDRLLKNFYNREISKNGDGRRCATNVLFENEGTIYNA
jgi:hypothetical protein